MEVMIQKWGNSCAVRIPSIIMKEMGLVEEDKLELLMEGNKLVMRKKLENKISLEERIKEYEGENLCKEFEWDENQGREIW